MLIDATGIPLAVGLSAANTHDSQLLEQLVDAVPAVLGPGGRPGRPRRRPAKLHADKGYDYPSCRQVLRRRGIAHTIPTRVDQRGRPGRQPGFDPIRYRQRNVVERCVNRLKQWRGIATRYDKRAVHFLGAIHLAAAVVWLN